MSFGSKLTDILGYSFNGENVDTNPNNSSYCGFDGQRLKQIIEQYTKDREVIYNGNPDSYSFFPLCQTLKYTYNGDINANCSYAGGLMCVKNLILGPNTNLARIGSGPGGSINVSINEWTGFMTGCNDWYDCKNIYFNRPVSEIPGRSYLQSYWGTSGTTIPIYFHGTDGVLDKNGNLIQE